jgi:methylated-DNA-protein-cysteine methyltransferase-like protein
MPMARAKNKNSIPQKLTIVRPSGKKESSFFEGVYEIARQIPRGRVTSYGAIAVCLGTRLSARMVGWAMNGAGRVRPKVPAHRVVNRNGMLSGKHHFATATRMQELLEKEGIKIENDTIVDFKNLFWDPSKKLF